MRTLLRSGLGLLATVEVVLGLWTLLSPAPVFHLGHLHGADGFEATVLAVLLAGSVLLPLALLGLAAARRPGTQVWEATPASAGRVP